MFSIQVTNYISNYIWCLSYQFFSCFTPPDGHCAGGMHPTGMHSCFTPVCHSFCSRGGLPQCMLGYPREQTPPKSRHPPESRHPPRADTPIPSRTDTPREQTPPRKQTPAYGLRAAGTHPTGMRSCYD